MVFLTRHLSLHSSSVMFNTDVSYWFRQPLTAVVHLCSARAKYCNENLASRPSNVTHGPTIVAETSAELQSIADAEESYWSFDTTASILARTTGAVTCI